MVPLIEHASDAQRFFTQVQGHTAELTYHLRQQQMVLDHTGVPEAIGGRGIAGQLVKAALEYARAHGYQVVPVCSYAALYLQRHPEYADVGGQA